MFRNGALRSRDLGPAIVCYNKDTRLLGLLHFLLGNSRASLPTATLL